MDGTKKTDATNPLSGLMTSSDTSRAKKTENKGQLDKTDFLNILVQQLKAQDPLDPMKNEEFAVNLAQFSQLEQLISINGKVGGGASDISSLAGYLGHDVLMEESSLSVKDGKAGNASITLPGDANAVTLELTGADGSVKSVQLGTLSKGQTTVKVMGVGSDGGDVEGSLLTVGTVSGFIPGADPKLIIGEREVSPTMVKQVRVSGL
jgi:flagellar basal-body rod modification protein FlgD